MDDKEELFVEGKEGEEDLLDFDFEELPEEVSAAEALDDESFDDEILTLTNIIKEGDIGVASESEKSGAEGEFEFDSDELDVDSIDFDDEEIAEKAASVEAAAAPIDDILDSKEIAFDLDDAFDELKEPEDKAPEESDMVGPVDAEDRGYETGSFDGDLSEIPDIAGGAVTEVGGGVAVPEVQEEIIPDEVEGDSGTVADEIIPIDEDDLESEPQELDLGAMIDEIEKEEIEAEEEILPLDQIREEKEEEPEPPIEELAPEPSQITDELVPESIELEDETGLEGLDKDGLEQMISGIVMSAVEKAVKETMAGTAERVIKETIEALKSSIESSEE
jgi:hypothetical protein